MLTRLRHLILLTLLGLPLTTPLWRLTAVPCTHDGHLHYHRIAAMRYAWENGLYFTRWLPDLAFGYGYPFFVYREPAPLYAGLFPHLLGLPLPAASNLFYALCILACGWFMFLWVRDVLGQPAAYVAAFAYMSAPYVLVDSLIRGNAPETLALPLFPLLLWAGRRWLLGGNKRPFLIATFSLALLSLSHNISLLIFTPTLLVYLLAIGKIYHLKWQPLLPRLVLLFGLGLGMTIFYSGGALLELNAVTLEQSTTTRNNDFRFNFASWGEILAPVTPEDPTLVNPPLPFRLGWVPLGLAVVGVVLFVWGGRGAEEQGSRGETRSPLLPCSPAPPLSQEQTAHIWLMLAATAVYLLMALPLSQPLWESLPLIDFVQFPWRFIGRAALPVAFLAGLPFSNQLSAISYQLSVSPTPHTPHPTPHALRYLLPLALLLLFLEAVPNLYPRICPEASFPTINDVHAYERETGLVGVDPEGSYFPRTVQKRPLSSPLEANYQAEQPPQRFDLPASVTIHSQSNQPRSGQTSLSSPEPFTARFLSFAFPGWVATVDGQPVPITPNNPEGLITFPVPAGNHDIAIRWGSTPIRSALVALSLLALAATTALGYWLSHFTTASRTVISYQSAGSPRRHERHAPPLITDYRLLITAFTLLLLKTAVFDHLPTALNQPGQPNITHPASLQAAELRLDGYNLSQSSVASGSTFDIDLAWTAVSAPTTQYQSNVWLADANGLLWSDKETHRPRLYEDLPPTVQWQPGEWGWDSREVAVLPGTPPGVYNIVVTQFDRSTLQPLTLTDSQTGAVMGPTAVLGQITVTLPNRPTPLTPQVAQSGDLAEFGLILHGYSQDREQAAPGDPLLLTLFWERTGDLRATFPLELRDAAGNAVTDWPLSPPASDDLWPRGYFLRAQQSLRLPASLGSGSYQFFVADIPLGGLAIEAPERVFVQPTVETALNTPFLDPGTNQPLTTLIGLTISNLQSPISLLWQANAETPTSYRVFIHLVDQDGQIVAQADGEPANWSRPTSGWAPGEYISDSHTLSLPTDLAPNLTLRIGLYNPATGQRLVTPSGGDFVVVPLP
ncbi:MAG: hypothetical protein H6668_24105 [Ardenticatenaceae bacterium]|nr:hypothetical protein [Ardenticatenaceae bacterium]